MRLRVFDFVAAGRAGFFAVLSQRRIGRDFHLHCVVYYHCGRGARWECARTRGEDKHQHVRIITPIVARVAFGKVSSNCRGLEMISRTQRILGLDIGSSTVKGVELSKNGNRFTVTGYAQAEISSCGTLRDTITAVLKEGRFKSKQVVSSVSGRSVIVRYINTPAMAADELKEAMRYEADKYIPFEMDEVILDTVPLEEQVDEEGDMRVVIVAVKKDIINEHVRLLQDGGLYPHIVDVDCFALGNAFELAAPAGVPEEVRPGPPPPPPAEASASEDGNDTGNAVPETPEDEQAEELDELLSEMGQVEPVDVAVDAPDEIAEPAEAAAEEQEEPEGPRLASAIPDLEEAPADGEQAGGAGAAEAQQAAPPEAEEGSRVYALVDIGAQKTNINIMNGQTSCFTREVYIGGEDMTEAVAKHMGISPVEAEAAKRSGDQESAVLEAVSQTLDDLANEIFLSFDYFENQFETDIKTVYLSGGGSRLLGIASVFAETLGRSVVSWNPAANIPVALAERQAERFRDNAPQLAVAMGLASRLRKV